MSKLLALRAAKTLVDFASLLDTAPSTLIHTLYRQPEAAKYTTFTVPKKSGGDRTIHAPIGKIKIYQRALANILYDCDEELSKANPRKPLSHGFRRGRSIVTHAAQHKNRRYVLNLDLADFFPTFHFGRVRGFFINDQGFALTPDGATILAQIACYQGALPQGSPCSPIIADLVAHILDLRLARFAKQHRVTYSRYADDITFSTNAKLFPAALATGGSDPSDPWVLAAPLIDRIENAGFQVNHAKTRMHVASSRQTVTGLTVNEKVNISQGYWRGIRSMCRSLFQTGSYYRPGTDPNDPKSIIGSLRPLRGMLAHAFHVKGSSPIKPESRARNILFGQKEHEDFYFFDYFVALDQPLIITEGPTDPVYLRNAIQRLPAFHPSLGEQNASIFSYKVRFFNYDNKIHKLLKLTGGSDLLKHFANTYTKRLSLYKYKPLKYPVIILLDNDSGLKEFSKVIKNNFNKVIDLTTKDPFYHLTDNLYVVKTPELGATGESCIEDLFGAAKNIPLQGKVLHLDDKTFDPTKHIKKVAFAKKVVPQNAGTIPWAGFDPLLKRVEAVLADYKPPTV